MCRCVSMSHFGEGASPRIHSRITCHFLESKTKCAILCQFFHESSLDVQMLEKISKHYFPWTCVMPRFLTIYKNTGVTGLWRGHCATGLVIFETSDLVMYRTSRVRMIFCARNHAKSTKDVGLLPLLAGCVSEKSWVCVCVCVKVCFKDP